MNPHIQISLTEVCFVSVISVDQQIVGFVVAEFDLHRPHKIFKAVIFVFRFWMILNVSRGFEVGIFFPF